MKLAALNLGCPKNSADLDLIVTALCNSDVLHVQDIATADAAIINTCAFIQPAIEESIETIFTVSKLKESRLKRLVVLGCLPQRFGADIRRALPEVDLVIAERDTNAISARLIDFFKITADGSAHGCHTSTPAHYAYVKIADGCDNRCAYCTIPRIKGGYRSISQERIIAHTRRLAERGAREIILVAQDTTDYGKELHNGESLISLMKGILQIEQLHWLRLMYAHPLHVSEQLIELLCDELRICRYIDIPIQHASDHILAAMGRGVTQNELLALFERLRTALPEIAIRSTVIVGFPGETEKEFTELLDFLEEVRIDRLGAFKYSREEGTRAFTLPGRISHAEMNDRHAAVLDLQACITEAKNRSMIGKRLEVLVDRYDETHRGYVGRTQWDCPEIDNEVIIEGENLTVGSFYPVRIVGSNGFDLRGSEDTAIKKSCVV